MDVTVTLTEQELDVLNKALQSYYESAKECHASVEDDRLAETYLREMVLIDEIGKKLWPTEDVPVDDEIVDEYLEQQDKAGLDAAVERGLAEEEE